MISKIAILCCLVVSATCMVLHQAPLYPVQYQEQAPDYNFDYNANTGHPGNFNGRDNQQESRRGENEFSQFSLRQPENIPRGGDYRSNDSAGYNAYLNNDRRQSNIGDGRYVETLNEEARPPNKGSQVNQPWPIPSIHQANPTPVTITQTSVYHQTYSHGHKSWI